MIPYIFAIGAYLFHIRQKQIRQKTAIPLAAACGIFLIWVMKGYGWETILLGIVFILSGIPFYLFTNKHK
jgi:hypothetical protein